MTRDEYVAAIKSAFVTVSTRLAQGWLVSMLPFLAWPIISTVVNAALNSLFSFLANESEMGAFFLYIDMRVGAQSQDFEKAAYDNFLIQQNGTPEQRKAAEDELWKKFVAFARLTA